MIYNCDRESLSGEHLSNKKAKSKSVYEPESGISGRRLPLFQQRKASKGVSYPWTGCRSTTGYSLLRCQAPLQFAVTN